MAQGDPWGFLDEHAPTATQGPMDWSFLDDHEPEKAGDTSGFDIAAPEPGGVSGPRPLFKGPGKSQEPDFDRIAQGALRLARGSEASAGPASPEEQAASDRENAIGSILSPFLGPPAAGKLAARAGRSIVETGARGAGTIGGVGERALNLLAPGDLTQAEMRRREARAGQTGAGLAKAAEEFLPPPRTGAEKFVEGAAPVAAATLTGPVGGAALLGATGIQQFQQARQRALAAGASPEEADLAMAENFPAVVAQQVPFGNVLSKIGKYAPTMRDLIGSAITFDVGDRTARALGQVVQNSIKPEDKSALAEFAKENPEQAATGFLVHFLGGMGVHVEGPSRERATTIEKPPTPVQERPGAGGQEGTPTGPPTTVPEAPETGKAGKTTGPEETHAEFQARAIKAHPDVSPDRAAYRLAKQEGVPAAQYERKLSLEDALSERLRENPDLSTREALNQIVEEQLAESKKITEDITSPEEARKKAYGAVGMEAPPLPEVLPEGFVDEARQRAREEGRPHGLEPPFGFTDEAFKARYPEAAPLLKEYRELDEAGGDRLEDPAQKARYKDVREEMQRIVEKQEGAPIEGAKPLPAPAPPESAGRVAAFHTQLRGKPITKFERSGKGPVYFSESKEGSISGAISGRNQREVPPGMGLNVQMGEEQAKRNFPEMTTHQADLSGLRVFGKDLPTKYTAEQYDALIDKANNFTHPDPEVQRIGRELIRRELVARRPDHGASTEQTAAYAEGEQPLTHTEAEDPKVEAALRALGYHGALVADEGGRSVAVYDTSKVPEPASPGLPLFKKPNLESKKAGAVDLFGQRKPEPEEVKPDKLGFYSPIEKALVEKMPNVADVEHVRNIAKQAQPREYEFSGLEDFLKDKKRVTKADVQKYLRENNVNVEEKEMGESNLSKSERDRLVELSNIADHTPEQAKEYRDLQSKALDEGARTKYQNYQLPGGKNYRELLLTMPGRGLGTPTTVKLGEHAYEVYNERGEPYGAYNAESEAAALERAKRLGPTDFGLSRVKQTEFKGGHFDEPNVLAHVRFNERTDAQGRKTLFLEEVQSDWAAKGEREGFGVTPRFTVIDSHGNYRGDFGSREEAQRYLDNPPADMREALFAGPDKPDIVPSGKSGVPNMPFKTREQYAKLALRRMIRYASEKGYDSISWTTGEQQAERYDLSKQVRAIDAHRLPDGTFDLRAHPIGGEASIGIGAKVPVEKLADIVGKDLAEKIRNQPQENQRWNGVDLKIGGEGMRSFYDKTLPKVANEIGKKWGAKAERTGLKGAGGVDAFDIEPEGSRWRLTDRAGNEVEGAPLFTSGADAEKWVQANEGVEVHTLAIPPAMRESVLKKGQPRLGRLDLLGGDRGKNPPPSKDVREEDSGGYEHINEYLGAKQLAEQTIDRNAIQYKQRVRDAGEDVGLAGRAVDFYAALKAKGEQGYDAFESKIPENERDAYEYAKTAPPEVKAVWDQMLADKKALGEHAESQIPDFKGRENYTMQAWKPVEGQAGGPGTSRPKFGLSTPREESRTFPTILEGLAAGRERAMPEGFENYARSGKQLTASIEARRLLDTLKKSELASTTPRPGWQRIESSKLFDSAEYRTPEGEAVKVSLPTYAEPKTAEALNKIIAVSKLQGIGPIETMKRINNAYRASVFYTGLFHPRQFIAREILSSPTLFKNPFSEYRKGLDAIRTWDDQTQLLVKNGLRLFTPQDFTPALKAEKGRFEKAVDKIPGSAAAKNGVKEFGDMVRRFTFERLGAAYKLMGAKAELAAWQTRHADELRQGTLTLEDGAKAVATAHNDLWGGQNWERILLDEKGLTSKLANPTTKDLLGLVLNTPDWTTSKVRLFVKAFEHGDGGEVRRLMWARTIGRAAAATVGANLIMSLFDDKDALDRYKAAWKASPLHLADVDWTPLHDAVFGADHARHYFGVVGALAEPLSWMIASDKTGKHFDPVKGFGQAMRRRESFIAKIANDYYEGSDPIGRAFTSTEEMLGGDRGRYKSSGPGRYKGQKKESLVGQFNSYKSENMEKGGPIGYDQMPSFVLGEAMSAMPIQAQAIYAKILGQLDWARAIGQASGLDITQAKPPEPKKSKR